jgi:DhnA family fructose-bisphosphate aldolase class Ia
VTILGRTVHTTLGRNIWRSGDTGSVIRALKRVVHEETLAGETLQGLG